ncbi:DUF1385 domain-containing protein [bacterium]|nr:DUF1385 domain-containing protein [bacterium]MCB2179373.1 DUF1385 domain-containing protein [bacterium]
MAEPKLPSYGGQAVIEGVMMRGAHTVAIAMRDPSDEIVIHTEELGPIYKSKMSKIPFLRGLVVLWDSLALGMRALTISANTQGDEDEQIEGPALYLTMAISLGFAVLLFFLAPAAAGHYIGDWLNIQSAWASNLIEGIIRILILIGYIYSIGRMEDIQRVFQYHGAEHKTINAFEDNAELTPEVVAQYSLEHPRCGTAFLLTVMVFSVILFTLIGPMPSILMRFASRVLLIPVLASISYEYIRWTANHLESPFVRALIKPNLALQHLTTNEPDLKILEVSIASFNAMRAKEAEYNVL